MRLLSLDQSARVTGWAVFEDGQLIKYDKFEYDSSIPIATRLCKIRQQVQNLINEYNIDEVVLEDIQLQNNVVNNVQTFKVLAEVFGVITELCEEIKIPWSAVLAASWKHTLGIKGANRAVQKKNAQQYVIDNYSIKVIQDVADAICIGVHKIKTDAESGFDWSE